MKKKVVLVTSLLVTASLLLTSCGTNKAASGNVTVDKKTNEVIKATDTGKLPDTAKNRKDTVIVGITAPDGKFNPIYSSSVYDTYVCNLIFDGLITNDKEGNAVANVAEKWDISEDNKTYTFHLNKGS